MRLMQRLRHSVGLRLLAGFWVTIILALVCVWLLTRWAYNDFDVSKLEQPESQLLNIATRRAQRGFHSGVPAERLVQPMPRMGNAAIVLYDISADNVIVRKSMFASRIKNDVKKLSDQRSPLLVMRPPYRLIGPKPIELGGKPYLLFIHKHMPLSAENTPRVGFLLVALFAMSVLFSLMFTRSLVKPISALRQASQALANGQWDTRVDPQQFGRDELGDLASAFNNMAQKLAENWASQKRLLADVSHELRSPLARLNMAVGLAEQAAEHSETTRKSFQRIEAETAKMDQLIGDVLTLSRTEAAMASKENVSLKYLLEDVLHNAEFEATQKGLAVTVDAIPELNVKVQKESIQSAVENVIRNAIRYTDSSVAISFAVAERHWQITVADDGPGLPEAQLAAVFAPFYRSDSARNLQTGGVGLGLAIAKAAVTAHHGVISAKNRPSGGLVVTIEMAINV